KLFRAQSSGLSSIKKEFYMSSRKEYIERLAAKLTEWDAEIDALEAKAKEKRAALEAQWQEARADLVEKRNELTAKLDELKGSADSSFEKLKAQLEVNVYRVRTKFNEVKDMFIK